MRLSFGVAVVAVSTGVAVIHGCGTDRSAFDGPAFDGGPNTTTESGASGDFGPGMSDAGNCDLRCSSDLHSLLDCNGTVVKTCESSLGCDSKTLSCTDACTSATSSRGSVGCEFYAVPPDPLGMANASCFAAFVTNTWDSPVTLSGDFGGAPLDIGTIARTPSGSGLSTTYAPLTGNQIPANAVAIVFLSGTCPAPSAGIDGGKGTRLAHAAHLVTDRPVAAYDIYPYGGGSSVVTSATLLLPTSTWDTNYVVVSPFEVSTLVNLPGAIHFVAKEDATSLTILPTKNIAGGPGVAGATKGVAATYSLAKGQLLTFAQSDLLDGSSVQTTKPVGMWSSMPGFNVPNNVPYADSAHQQIPPVKALGSEYALVRYRNRLPTGPEETPPWRILGLVDGTNLSWEPSVPAGAPTAVGAGQLVTFYGAGPYVVKSQDDDHPIYVSAHMTGCSTVGDLNQGTFGCVGDAEFVNVVPAKEFQSSYIFFADPTYPESNLVLVRSKGKDGAFHDVNLDCAGAISGWAPLGTGSVYEFARFDLVRGDFVKQGTCDNGRHEIKSDAPFGITLWGWGTKLTSNSSHDFYSQAVSYAYPGGMSLKPINSVVVPSAPK